MNILGTLALAFNPGRNNPMVLFPACVSLFIGTVRSAKVLEEDVCQ